MANPFNLRTLGGILGSNKRPDDLELQRARGNEVADLMAYKGWSVMERLFDLFRDEAVTALGAKNIKDSQRLTNRIELISDIRKKLQSIKDAGIEAGNQLEKMEKTHV